MSLVGDIATFLAASGVGIYDPVTPAPNNPSTIFTYAMPPVDATTPASAFSIEAYGSAPPGPYLLDSTLPEWENPRFQITRRDPDPAAAEAGIYAATKALIVLGDVALGGVHYFSVRLVSGPLGIGRDELNLWRYTANFQAMKVFS